MDNVGVVFTWSVCISKYGNQCKYSHKVRGKKEKKNKHLDMVVDNVHRLCGLCTFPNMSINANIARKSGEKRQKKDMMQTVVDSVGVVLTWSVCTVRDKTVQMFCDVGVFLQ